MISTEGEPPEHVHQPHIIINQNGLPKRAYKGFDQVNGDVRLDVYPKGKPLSRYIPVSESDPRQSFDLLVDIEKDLYPNDKLNVNTSICRTRLHFSSGELYTSVHFTNVKFADAQTGQSMGFWMNVWCQMQTIVGDGTGSDVTITYNPRLKQDGPAFISLGHELIHADDAAHGRMDPEEVDGVRNYERQAIGLAPYEGKEFTENKMRNELSIPARLRY
jgi:hypothetical protein